MRCSALVVGVGLVLALVLVACGSREEATSAAAGGSEPSPGPVESVPAPATAATPQGAPSDEACAEAIVIQWRGAESAAEGVTRSETEARALAEELLHSIESGAREFGEVARDHSDARGSGSRGGLIGTFSRQAWPPQHEAIRDRVFALAVGEVSEVLQTPYGWVIARRCPAEYRHTRHILVRFAGARNAGPEIRRSRDEARALAVEIRRRALEPGADFAALARETSEDGSAERGGDMGWLGRGRLTPSYEAAAFALPVGGVSEPVESPFGFHVIQRVE